MARIQTYQSLKASTLISREIMKDFKSLFANLPKNKKSQIGSSDVIFINICIVDSGLLLTSFSLVAPSDFIDSLENVKIVRILKEKFLSLLQLVYKAEKISYATYYNMEMEAAEIFPTCLSHIDSDNNLGGFHLRAFLIIEKSKAGN